MNSEAQESNTSGNVSPVPAAPPQGHSKKKVFALVASFVLVASLSFAIAYFWQKQKLNNEVRANSELSAQLEQSKKLATTENVSETQSPQEQAPAATQSSDDLAPGPVDFDNSNLRGQPGYMYIDGYVKPTGNWQEIWMDYGTAPDKLTTQSEHITKELNLGSTENYSAFTFLIKKSSLQPGTVYFYRISGKTSSGTVQSGIAAFTSMK